MVRICYVGSYRGPSDEGMRRIALETASCQRSRNEVLTVNPESILFSAGTLKEFRPEIIHYLSGPSILSFLLLNLARIETGCSRTVMTASHPFTLGLFIIPGFMKPTLILAQSEEMISFFEAKRIRTEFMPNGVDTRRFKPATPSQRRETRERYGIEKSKYAVLHVGNLREGRNLLSMVQIARSSDYKVIIVSSTSIKPYSGKLKRRLEEEGVIVIDGYLHDIERLYSSCDAYAFPTIEKGSAVQIPLSILEAMACDLPVVTTRYGGLPIMFREEEWFRYEEPERFLQVLDEFRRARDRDGTGPKTRHMIEDLSWERVGADLHGIYKRIITNEHP